LADDTKRTFRGVAAEALRVAIERSPHDQVVRWIGDAMERRYPGARLVGEPVIHDDREQNVISIAASYTVPKLAIDRNGTWVVYFRPANMRGVLPRSPSASRTTPLRIAAFPFFAKYTFEIIFPEEVSVITDPQSKTVSDRYFSLTASHYFRGNVARASIELTTLRSSVNPNEYSKYVDDLQAATKAIGGFFAIGKSAIKSNNGLQQASFPQRLRELREQAVKETTKTIASGKLSGSDLADAYCNRSAAFSDLGRYEEALHDADKAIQLAPNEASLLACRAEDYFQAGQFDKSIADYSNAISFGAIVASTFKGRGISRFYAGQLEEAGADFAKALGLAGNETKVYSAIWLTVAYGRLGKPTPKDIIRQAAEEPRGQWPRPVLAMLTGAMSPEALLKLIDQKKGDERQMALSEAYFYIGQHYLIVGDKKSAQASFEKAREQGVMIYIEHVAAGFELQRLRDGTNTFSAGASTTKHWVAQ
jgi:lipoprotein NlpI